VLLIFWVEYNGEGKREERFRVRILENGASSALYGGENKKRS